MKEKILVWCCILGILAGFAARFFLTGTASRYALAAGLGGGFLIGFLLDKLLNRK